MIDFLDSCIYTAIKAIIGLIIISIVLSLLLGIITLAVNFFGWIISIWDWTSVISFTIFILIICVIVFFVNKFNATVDSYIKKQKEINKKF